MKEGKLDCFQFVNIDQELYLKLSKMIYNKQYTRFRIKTVIKEKVEIMSNAKGFHPGIYIMEYLDAMKMTSKELSAKTGIPEETLSSIMNGNSSITYDVAYKLSEYFNSSVNFWINLQKQYDMYTKKAKTK